MARALVTSATLLLLWVLVAQINHYLAPLHVSLFPAGLYVTFAALHLPLRGGLGAVLLAGLLCDASVPATLGTQTLLFALACLAIQQIRDRLPREETLVQVLVASVANAGLFLAFSFTQWGRVSAPAAVWGRLFFDLLSSQAFVVSIGPWFFALQARALRFARTETSPID